MPDNSEAILTRIREHAYASLSARAKQNTNLYLDSRIYKKRETIGPEFQQIAAPRDSILVFADDSPEANFGHDCRYLLYDPAGGTVTFPLVSLRSRPSRRRR